MTQIHTFKSGNGDVKIITANIGPYKKRTNVIKKIVKIINLIFFLFLIYNSFLTSIYLVIKLTIANTISNNTIACAEAGG